MKSTPLDLLIRNARIVDGAGNPWFHGDLGVRRGRIAAVGRLNGLSATHEIDARGRVLCPGFIDIHTHSDLPLIIEPGAESKVRQGVTTEVIGLCGISAAPLVGEAVDQMRTRLNTYNPPPALDWATMAEYLKRLERQGLGLNCVPLVGHGALRASAMGMRSGAPTPAEMDAMKKLLRQAMSEGAWGMSTGLIYPPGCYSDTEELIELARQVAALGGLYFTHARGDDPGEDSGIHEAIRISREARVPSHVAHLHGVVRHADLISQARRDGLDVTFDQYPYTAGSGPMKTLIPAWAHDGGSVALVVRLKDADTLARIRAEMAPTLQDAKTAIGRRAWQDIVVCNVITQANKAFEGKTLAAIAEARSLTPFDALVALLIEEKAEARMIVFGQSEDGVRAVMKHPAYMVGSDGSALCATGPLSAGKPHPRNYGTFPRVLARYVRELKHLRLEEAIRQMTSAAASRLRLPDRGLLRPGMAADLVLFDPDQIADTATYEDPHRYPVGIAYVLVNGQIALAEGERLAVRPGRVLRSTDRRDSVKA